MQSIGFPVVQGDLCEVSVAFLSDVFVFHPDRRVSSQFFSDGFVRVY